MNFDYVILVDSFKPKNNSAAVMIDELALHMSNENKICVKKLIINTVINPIITLINFFDLYCISIIKEPIIKQSNAFLEVVKIIPKIIKIFKTININFL